MYMDVYLIQCTWVISEGVYLPLKISSFLSTVKEKQAYLHTLFIVGAIGNSWYLIKFSLLFYDGFQ